MLKKLESGSEITDWAKTNNKYVDGLNYSFNGEDYEYLQLHCSDNKAIGAISVTKHLFNEGDFIHLTMTLGLRIIIDTISNYLSNKYQCHFDAANINELHSVKIERIANLENISIRIEESDAQITSGTYSGSFLIAFGDNNMVFTCYVSGKIEQKIPHSGITKICYEDYRIDLNNIYIHQNESRSNAAVYKNANPHPIADTPFGIIFNILINQIFIYCSYDCDKNGSRFILARDMHYIQNTNQSSDNNLYLTIEKKENVRSRISYTILIHDECVSFKFNMEFLYQVNEI